MNTHLSKLHALIFLCIFSLAPASLFSLGADEEAESFTDEAAVFARVRDLKTTEEAAPADASAPAKPQKQYVIVAEENPEDRGKTRYTVIQVGAKSTKYPLQAHISTEEGSAGAIRYYNPKTQATSDQPGEHQVVFPVKRSADLADSATIDFKAAILEDRQRENDARRNPFPSYSESEDESSASPRVRSRTSTGPDASPLQHVAVLAGLGKKARASFLRGSGSGSPRRRRTSLRGVGVGSGSGTPAPTQSTSPAPTPRAAPKAVVMPVDPRFIPLGQNKTAVKRAKALAKQTLPDIKNAFEKYEKLKKRIQKLSLSDFRTNHSWATHFLTDASVKQRQAELATSQAKLEQHLSTIQSQQPEEAIEITVKQTLAAKLHLEIEDIKKRQRDLSALQERRTKKGQIALVESKRIAPWRVAVADSFVPKALVGLTDARLLTRANNLPNDLLLTTEAAKKAKGKALFAIKKLQDKAERQLREAFEAVPEVNALIESTIRAASTTQAPLNPLADTARLAAASAKKSVEPAAATPASAAATLQTEPPLRLEVDAAPAPRATVVRDDSSDTLGRPLFALPVASTTVQRRPRPARIPVTKGPAAQPSSTAQASRGSVRTVIPIETSPLSSARKLEQSHRSSTSASTGTVTAARTPTPSSPVAGSRRSTQKFTLIKPQHATGPK